MGQRLVITIENDDKKLCNIYYHWSAYSYSALVQTKEIIGCIYDNEDESESELLLRLIHFCEEMGGGIPGGENSKEWNYIQSLYPNETFKKDGISRNDGLISLSKDGMDESDKWSEGDITINIDGEIIYNSVYNWYEDIESYKEDHKDWDDNFNENMQLEDIKEIAYDLAEISIYDLDDVIHELDASNEFTVRYKNTIYDLIC